MCIDTHFCTVSKVNGIHKEKEVCLSNKDYINGYRCRRTNIDAKWKLCIAVKYYRHLQETNMTAKQGLFKGS